VSISGAADTDATFSFDADWGNGAYWAPFVYDYITTNDRERRTYNQEVRVLSKPGAIAGGRGDWLVGVYALDLEESNDHLDLGAYEDPFCGPACTFAVDNPAISNYEATNVALFGQLRVAVGERLELTTGLRVEQRSASYGDSFGNRFDPDDDMLGGELALSWRLDDRRSTYLRFARGYKAGGFNVALAGVDFDGVDNGNLTPEEIEFDPESLASIEAGYRAASEDGRLRADAGVFYARRDDQQIKIPIQLRLGDPSSFLFVTANSERGEHYGLEGTLDWRATERLDVSAALGWLRTEIDRFSLFPELDGREQAHAPAYTYSLGAEYRAPSGWWGRVDVSGMDEYFFDYGHDQESEPYALTNLRVGRKWGPWDVSLWVRNLFDEEYFVRGFFFGNEPPDFAGSLYTRLGDPRHYGLTVRYEL
jgi:iron complex outermembrane receptor protein